MSNMRRRIAHFVLLLLIIILSSIVISKIMRKTFGDSTNTSTLFESKAVCVVDDFVIEDYNAGDKQQIRLFGVRPISANMNDAEHRGYIVYSDSSQFEVMMGDYFGTRNGNGTFWQYLYPNPTFTFFKIASNGSIGELSASHRLPHVVMDNTTITR